MFNLSRRVKEHLDVINRVFLVHQLPFDGQRPQLRVVFVAYGAVFRHVRIFLPVQEHQVPPAGFGKLPVPDIHALAEDGPGQYSVRGLEQLHHKGLVWGHVDPEFLYGLFVCFEEMEPCRLPLLRLVHAVEPDPGGLLQLQGKSVALVVRDDFCLDFRTPDPVGNVREAVSFRLQRKHLHIPGKEVQGPDALLRQQLKGRLEKESLQDFLVQAFPAFFHLCRALVKKVPGRVRLGPCPVQPVDVPGVTLVARKNDSADRELPDPRLLRQDRIDFGIPSAYALSAEQAVDGVPAPLHVPVRNLIHVVRPITGGIVILHLPADPVKQAFRRLFLRGEALCLLHRRVHFRRHGSRRLLLRADQVKRGVEILEKEVFPWHMEGQRKGRQVFRRFLHRHQLRKRRDLRFPFHILPDRRGFIVVISVLLQEGEIPHVFRQELLRFHAPVLLLPVAVQPEGHGGFLPHNPGRSVPDQEIKVIFPFLVFLQERGRQRPVQHRVNGHPPDHLLRERPVLRPQGVVLPYGLVLQGEVFAALFVHKVVHGGVRPSPLPVHLEQAPGRRLLPGGSGNRQAADPRCVQQHPVQKRVGLPAGVPLQQGVHGIPAGRLQPFRPLLREHRAHPGADPVVHRLGRLGLLRLPAGCHGVVQLRPHFPEGRLPAVQQVVYRPGEDIFPRRVQVHRIGPLLLRKNGNLRPVPGGLPVSRGVHASSAVEGNIPESRLRLLPGKSPAPGIVGDHQHRHVRAVSVGIGAQPGPAEQGLFPRRPVFLLRPGARPRQQRRQQRQPQQQGNPSPDAPVNRTLHPVFLLMP